MVDMHCHILPGVDDGAKTTSESKRMLDIAARGGVKTIIATPHYRGKYKDRAAQHDAYLALCPEAKARGIDLQFGCEFYYNEFEPDEVASYRTRFCLGATNRLLFELGHNTAFSDVEEILYCLQRQQLELVIAHPERNVEMQMDHRMCERYYEMGCLFQLSADALVQSFTSASRRAAKYLLKHDMVDFIASDAHCPQDYETFLRVVAKLN